MLSHLSRKISRKTTSTDATIEEVSRNEAKTLEEKFDRSTNYRGSVKIVIRKKLRSSTDSQVLRRCQVSF